MFFAPRPLGVQVAGATVTVTTMVFGMVLFLSLFYAPALPSSHALTHRLPLSSVLPHPVLRSSSFLPHPTTTVRTTHRSDVYRSAATDRPLTGPAPRSPRWPPVFPFLLLASGALAWVAKVSRRDVAATEVSEPLAPAAKFLLDVGASCQCKRGKVCRAGPQPWRGLADVDCGEDSFFMTSRCLGVADGVTGSRTPDSDPSVLANRLMEYAQADAIAREFHEDVSPVDIMQTAYDKVAAEGTAQGATTALVACVCRSGSLTTATLGDSTLIVVRDHNVVFRTTNTWWDFSFPYMLTVPAKTSAPIPSRTPKDCCVERFQLQPDDLLVAATDCVWDNLFLPDVLNALAAARGSPPGDVAQSLLREAVAASEDRYRRTPYVLAADEAGLDHQGGKPDDCTVVVARVVLA